MKDPLNASRAGSGTLLAAAATGDVDLDDPCREYLADQELGDIFKIEGGH